MDYYAGIDVSLEYSSVCVVDASGKVVREAKVALARKLAVIMLRMLKDNVPFNPAAKPATA